MRVRAVDFVVSHVPDVPKAASFYRETLGIEDAFLQDGTISGDGVRDTWTEFDTSPVALALVRWEEEAGRTGIGLAVDDVDGAIEELRAKGVEIVMEPVDGPGCRMGWVKDPWGNLLCIHHRHDGTAG